MKMLTHAERATHEILVSRGQPGGDPSDTDGSFSLSRGRAREAVVACDMVCGWGGPCAGLSGLPLSGSSPPTGPPAVTAQGEAGGPDQGSAGP